jgi:hypothetical protein
MPAENPLPLVPLAPEPVRPFNVVRHRDEPILTATELTSYAYRRLLAGTPWEFYRLVVTQWPRVEGNQALPIPRTLDGSILNKFPGAGSFSAFNNVTMETFDQHDVQLGCMSCHDRARMTADFMWSLLDHAYPARLSASIRAGARMPISSRRTRSRCSTRRRAAAAAAPRPRRRPAAATTFLLPPPDRSPGTRIGRS